MAAHGSEPGLRVLLVQAGGERQTRGGRHMVCKGRLLVFRCDGNELKVFWNRAGMGVDKTNMGIFRQCFR